MHACSPARSTMDNESDNNDVSRWNRLTTRDVNKKLVVVENDIEVGYDQLSNIL